MFPSNECLKMNKKSDRRFLTFWAGSDGSHFLRGTVWWFHVFAHFRALQDTFFTIPRTYTKVFSVDGVASITYFIEETIDYANNRVWLHFFLPPKENYFNIAHCFCQRQESNPGRLLSKQMRYPLCHCLSSFCKTMSSIFGPDLTKRRIYWQLD